MNTALIVKMVIGVIDMWVVESRDQPSKVWILPWPKRALYFQYEELHV
jgi:hypothetical protein